MSGSQTRFAVLLFTDIVGSTDLKARHGVQVFSEALRTHNGHFERLAHECRGIRILHNMGDGYFAEGDSVAEVVKFALLFQDAMRDGPWGDVRLTTRVGIHAGEISALDTEAGSGVVAPAADFTARVMSLALGGQILLTRFPFDEARHFLREHPPVQGKTMPPLRWLDHGKFTFKGVSDAIEVFEVGTEGVAPLQRPPNTEKVRRYKDLLGANRAPSRRWQLAILALVACSILGAAGFALRAHRTAEKGAAGSEMERAEVERQVARLKESPVELVKANPPGSKEVDLVQVDDNADFEVLRDERRYDLRGWREVPPEKMSDMFSSVTSLRRLALKKIGPADRFSEQWRTSGLNIFVSARSQYPFQIEIQSGDTITGKERMKVRKVSTDVSSVEVGSEFTLNSVATMWNSLQTENEQWLGLMGYKKSFLASMLIVFPEEKHFTDYRLTVSQTTKSEQTEYSGPRVVILGQKKDWIFWKVPNPQPGYVYRLYWKW